ncbi:MAG TPA: hypothetical protein VFO28_17570 [Burkholderiaceae bacterium]|nr:hypothetical protein [Burkholderiaceae bacterium]
MAVSKTIELRGGPASGHRIQVPAESTEVTVPVDRNDRFGAWAVYRPGSERCSDGTEIWDEHVDTGWGDTGLGDL